MATPNNESYKYDKLREGHAKALGFDVNNMSEEQEHELAERLENYGVSKPQNAPALPGTAAINPSAGNDGEITPTVRGRAKRTNKKAVPATAPVSPANFSPEVMQVFEHMAQQGDATGLMGMQIFRSAMSRQIKNGITNLVLDATQDLAILEESADAFLDRVGY